jgi:hypothetical protein
MIKFNTKFDVVELDAAGRVIDKGDDDFMPHKWVAIERKATFENRPYRSGACAQTIMSYKDQILLRLRGCYSYLIVHRSIYSISYLDSLQMGHCDIDWLLLK